MTIAGSKSNSTCSSKNDLSFPCLQWVVFKIVPTEFFPRRNNNKLTSCCYLFLSIFFNSSVKGARCHHPELDWSQINLELKVQTIHTHVYIYICKYIHMKKYEFEWHFNKLQILAGFFFDAKIMLNGISVLVLKAEVQFNWVTQKLHRLCLLFPQNLQ